MNNKKTINFYREEYDKIQKLLELSIEEVCIEITNIAQRIQNNSYIDDINFDSFVYILKYLEKAEDECIKANIYLDTTLKEHTFNKAAVKSSININDE